MTLQKLATRNGIPGRHFLVRRQAPNGMWQGEYSATASDTCFALLFLKRANVAADLGKEPPQKDPVSPKLDPKKLFEDLPQQKVDRKKGSLQKSSRLAPEERLAQPLAVACTSQGSPNAATKRRGCIPGKSSPGGSRGWRDHRLAQTQRFLWKIVNFFRIYITLTATRQWASTQWSDTNGTPIEETQTLPAVQCRREIGFRMLASFPDFWALSPREFGRGLVVQTEACAACSTLA